MRALVIGMGAGAQHAQAYKEEGLDVVVCDSNPEKALGWDWTDDYRSELRDADIVSICTPDESHFQLACEALNLGKYVVEKPPCLSVDEMAHLKTFDDHLYCNLPLPFHFKNLIEEFEGKDPYLIECDYLWGRHHKLVEGWRSEGKYSIILGAGLHMFDLLLCFKPEGMEDGACLGANKSGVNATYDCVQSIMRWKDGTMGRVGLNCAFEGDHEHLISVWSREYHRTVSNKESVDKTAGIRDFVNRISSGQEIRNDRLWNALGLCFQLGDVA